MYSIICLLSLALMACSVDAPTPGNRPDGKSGDNRQEQVQDTSAFSPKDISLYLPSSSAVRQNSCTVKAKLTLGEETAQIVNHRLLGFNIVYCDNPDSRWADGTLATAIKDVCPGFLRYPGGTVVTYFHWKNPSGNGWTDSWDPSYKASSNKDPKEFMDLDEYLKLVTKTGAEPLLGINCNSGFLYNRQNEGLKDALDMMKYVKSKGYNVKYWFVGNEPFAKNGNGGQYTPEKYAEMVLAYAKEMKEYDPSIKIIVNDHGNIFKNWSDYDTILDIAGKYIDVIDVHSYWSHGTANWTKFLKDTPCVMSGYGSYEAEVKAFHEKAAKKGYPDLEFATLEWNCGPSDGTENPFTSADGITLVQTEMIMQFMKGGMDMACFWPLMWTGDYAFRGFAAKKESKLFPIAYVMKDFSYYLGRNIVKTTLPSDKTKLYALAVNDDKSGKKLICIMNKYDTEIGIDLDAKGADAIVKSYTYDVSADKIGTDDLHWENSSCIKLNPYSVAFIVL